mmetsp:Transcript_35005/g.85082  ORF Transcript_35005/g.85082 Transcript_35005/m.85082 type:complete len:290 (-) Transcript_35005:998-1867(-)
MRQSPMRGRALPSVRSSCLSADILHLCASAALVDLAQEYFGARSHRLGAIGRRTDRLEYAPPAAAEEIGARALRFAQADEELARRGLRIGRRAFAESHGERQAVVIAGKESAVLGGAVGEAAEDGHRHRQRFRLLQGMCSSRHVKHRLHAAQLRRAQLIGLAGAEESVVQQVEQLLLHLEGHGAQQREEQRGAVAEASGAVDVVSVHQPVEHRHEQQQLLHRRLRLRLGAEVRRVGRRGDPRGVRRLQLALLHVEVIHLLFADFIQRVAQAAHRNGRVRRAVSTVGALG